MNRAEGSNSLQADLRKFRGSTFERKQMSTTIKRVALVAVAALGLGVVSVAPSTAVTNADLLVVSAATAAQTTAETSTASSATTTLSYLAGAAEDSMTVTASLVSGPAGSTALPVLEVVETSSAQSYTTIGGSVLAKKDTVLANNKIFVVPSATTYAAAVSAKFKVYLAKTDAVTAPTVAGTYVVKLTPAVSNGGGSLNASAQTITITVTAAPALDTVAASATSIITSTADTTTAEDAAVTFAKTATLTNEAAYIKVTLKNAAGSTVSAESYTATVAGPGLLGSGPLTDSYSGDARGRAITVKNGDVVTVYGDGSSGVSTITISSAAGVILATEKVTFYGDIASIVATVAKPVIGVRDNTAAVTAKAYDAAGVLVSSGTLYIASTDSTIITPTATSASIDATKGYASFALTGVKAGTTTVTVGNKATASTVSAAAGSVRVGGGAAQLADVKVTLDKASYAPGEVATLTVTPVDAAGLVLADETYTVFATGGITSSYVLQNSDVLTGTAATKGGVAGVGTVSGVATYKIYMPVTEGDVKFSWTTGTLAASTANSAVAGSVTVAVSSAATSAAIDAANEAAQAASDATDAALAAADAADAATTKAQEAVDAVATLSAQVSKLITALKAQITTLTNLVIKIQKKVKA